MEVYLDVLMLLNFLVDLLLILATNRLCGHTGGVKRAVAASVLGGFYAGACVLPGFRFLGGTVWRLLALGLMGMVAFGAKRGCLRSCVLFVLLSMALGGIALGIGYGGFWSLLLSALLVCLMCMVGFQGGADTHRYVPVFISLDGKSVSLMALVDTGNTLRDPISGRSVLVVDASAAVQLLGLDAHALAHPLETMASAQIHGLRLIPYTAVGQPGGILLGVLADCVKVDGKCVDCVVAFAPNRIGQGNYRALAGGCL